GPDQQFHDPPANGLPDRRRAQLQRLRHRDDVAALRVGARAHRGELLDHLQAGGVGGQHEPPRGRLHRADLHHRDRVAPAHGCAGEPRGLGEPERAAHHCRLLRCARRHAGQHPGGPRRAEPGHDEHGLDHRGASRTPVRAQHRGPADGLPAAVGMVVAHHRAIKGALAAASAALVGCAVLSSPAHTPRTGELVALTFHGPGFHPVEMDGYGLARGPHFPVRAELPLVSPDLPRYYLENGAPIAYLRGSRPEATLEAAGPEDWSGDVAVHGVGEGWRLDGAGIAEHGRLRATVRASEPLPDAIDLVERFTIDWTAEHRGNRLAIGRSANSLYVLRAPPTSPLVHTPLHIAATNARGVQDEDSIVARIWHEFTDREVRRVRDGRVLRYYGEWNDKAPAELRRMLVGGTGQCVAWSYLLY